VPGDGDVAVVDAAPPDHVVPTHPLDVEPPHQVAVRVDPDGAANLDGVATRSDGPESQSDLAIGAR
jgi:hypothetical protein